MNAVDESRRMSKATWVAAMFSDLVDWIRRRPVETPPAVVAIRHSADTRMTLWLIAGSDLVTAVAIDLMLPPTLRPLHLGLEAVLLTIVLGITAMTSRAPHLLGDGELRVRTGPFGEVAVPLASIRTVRAVHERVDGFGLRAGPEDDKAVACSTAAGTTLSIEVEPPVPVRLRKGGVVEARVLRFSADEPSVAARLIRGAVADAQG